MSRLARRGVTRTLAFAAAAMVVASATAWTPPESQWYEGPWWSTVHCVAWSADGRTIATGEGTSDPLTERAPRPSAFDCVRLWDASGGNEIRRLDTGDLEVGPLPTGETQRFGVAVTAAAFHPNGKVLVTGCDDASIRLWDVASGQELFKIRAHRSTVTTVVFLPSGKILATGERYRTIRLWEMPSDRELKEVAIIKFPPQPPIKTTAISADGQMAALAEEGHLPKIILRDLDNPRQWRELEGHHSAVESLAFSPDGSLLASTSQDLSVRIWDAAKGQQLHCLKGHEHWIPCVAWTPDGKVVVSGSWDDTIRFWDPTEGAEIRRLQPDAGMVLALAFSPDGKRLVTVTTEKILIWDHGFDKPIVTMDRVPLPAAYGSGLPGSFMKLRGRHIRAPEPSSP